MADAAELKRIQQTLDYFNRYYEFDSAIKVLQENRQYLETYIRTRHYVEDKYDAYGRTRKSMLIACIAAVVGALLVLLITGFSNIGAVSIIVAAVVAAVCWCGVFFVFKTLINKAVSAKWEEQQKVNADIATQIEDIDKRCDNLLQQKNSYLSGLDEKKLIVIPSKYIIEAPKIAKYVTDGQAQTAEEAVKMYEDEQNRLKERALAEKKRREEEAAAAKSLNIERERQRAIREKRAEELRRVAEEERQRANITPPSEQPEEAQMSAAEQKSGGLSLAMSGSSRKSARSSAPAQAAADTDKAPAREQREEQSPASESAGLGGLAMRGQKPREHRTVESVMLGGEMDGQSTQPQGSGLSLASDKKKRPQRTAQATKPQEAKPKKYEPIRLVDEPDDTPQAVDEETLDIEARMQSLLTANKPVLKRRSPMSQAQRESIEKRIESQLEAEQPKTEAPAEQAAPQQAAEQIPTEQAAPAVSQAPTAPAAAETEEPAAVAEEPKNPFSGLAMKKK